MTYRIILFDFDGTLADSAQCSILATQAAFAALLADFRRLLQRLYRRPRPPLPRYLRPACPLKAQHKTLAIVIGCVPVRHQGVGFAKIR